MQHIRTRGFVTNIVVLLALWGAYSGVRWLTSGDEVVALHNAETVWDLQESVGLAIEPALQSVFLTEWTALITNMYYLVHFPATAALLVFAYVESREQVFPVLRNGLVAMTLVGLAIHVVFPLAPPRLLDGFIDATMLHGPNPYDLPLSGAANQFAAMPSMHVGWAIAFSWGLVRLTERNVLWIIGRLHPPITVFVVLVTGHHFIADVLVGTVLAVASLAAVSGVRASKSSHAIGGRIGNDGDVVSTVFPQAEVRSSA